MNDITTQNRQNLPVGKFSIGSDAIKYFAALAMLLDHIAWCFVDTNSVLGYIMHTIGRMTAPIMTYFLVEGFYYTRNVNKYLLRLGIFAAASWIPFIFMEFGTLSPFVFDDGNMYFNPMQGVIYTFFMTLLSLKVVHSEKLKKPVKVLLVFGICILSTIGDWFFFPIIWALLLDKFRGNFKKQAIAFAVSSAVLMTGMIARGGDFLQNSFQYGVLLALIPLYFYNGQKGRSGKFNKWFFYVFYPVHMLLLGVLRWYVLI
ncbi:MAG: TraX family protein [Oscillospiraceae bacterium]